ncbi:2-hydroxyacid dehydrogenase [Pantoea rwandensis]|uniref:Hydroxyacid dehydrogenase n=1 Tax=Pantoea rwandensis TaxID=1076550 RepID=A0A1X1CV69_9GAMM|nr:2-hydroxyacid dehydrogenase [Pantoea rwandensis]ORM68318.1 hydroxyacid dehydrogenase [Pantoea rwandensis]
MSVILRANKVPQTLVDALSTENEVIGLEMLSPENAHEIEIILASGESIVDDVLINTLTSLRLIAVFGVGYDGIDIRAAQQRDISVTNTPDILTDDVADLAIGLMLSVARRINDAQRFIERGDWQNGSYPPAVKISGKRLGIVGFGRIGRAVARRAQGFSMQISYYSRSQSAAEGVTYSPSLVTLAENSDVLMVCASGGKESHHLINKEVLDALGPDGIIINVARGSVIDEGALLEAINTHRIGGAGLDVFADEPHAPQAFYHRDNVVITPHIGSATQATRAAMAKLVMDNIAAFQAGQPLLTPVI